jgi:NAD-dependent DNA ligase
MEGRKKGEKIENKGRFTQEKDIFDFLNMEFKEPSERVIHGVSKRNVTKKDSSQVKSSSDSEKTKRTTKKKSPESTGESCKRIGKSQNIMGFVEEFKKNGIQVLQQRNEDELASMIDIANNAFHCLGEPIMTDNEFDILREYMEKKFPKNAALNEVGATVEKNKVTLPYEMWSMDKIKPDTEVLNNWKKKYSGPYVVSCKLDGVSGLYTTEGDIPKLYTRGDGKIGQDISHMIPYLRLPELKGVVVRGEFIINRNTFKEKYESKFANPRNLVAGIVNQKKKEQDKYSDIHFVAYEMIKHPGFDSTNITPSQQMKTLTSMNFETVQNDMLTLENLTNDTLSNILQDWRSNYEYEIDGIIVVDDKVHPRTSGNPKHAFAFKMVLSDQVAEAHVVDVLWSASKDGYLKPRVQIMPIKLGGVTITYATGFNGAFIENNKIGIGAVIMLVRSGDVIPYIKSVTTPATQAKMPDVEYIWNDTHIDIMLKDKSQDTTVIEKNITGFFKQLEVDGIGSGNVKKIMKAGYNDICKIIHMSKDDLLKVEGFKEKTAQKLFDGIQDKIKNATVLQLAAASNMFGRGFSDKKLELIFQSYPNVLVDREPEQNKIDALQKIKGLERKTAEAFVRNIDIFKNFLKECRLESKLENIEVIPTKVLDNSHPLFDKNIVMTGFRNKELEQKIKDVGGKNASSVNSKTFVLLVKSLEDTSSKIEEAKKLEVRIMIPDDFIREYEL